MWGVKNKRKMACERELTSSLSQMFPQFPNNRENFPSPRTHRNPGRDRRENVNHPLPFPSPTPSKPE